MGDGGVLFVGKVVAGATGGGKGGKTTRGPPKGGGTDHHVMTNKNRVSAVRGGPWTPRFDDMAKKAGMTLDDVANRVRVPGHRGPHPQAYHQEVFQRLKRATEGLSGDAYSRAFREQLAKIRAEAATPGSRLNQLITKD